MNSKTLKKIIFILPTFIFCIAINANNNSSMIGYWLTSQSIVQVKECEQGLCAIIEYIFVENGVNQESILDENNKNKSLRCRTLVGIDLLGEFEIKNNNQKIFKGGKIYDPRSGNTYKSNLYLSQDGILKVEGCLAFICDGEEWQPLIVKINEDGSREALLKNSPQSN